MYITSKKTSIYFGGNASDNSRDMVALVDNVYRLPAHYHQQYEFVYAIEDDFSTHLNWRHELDEMVRLIGGEGYLTIKCGQNLNLNILNIKNFLGRRFGIEVAIESESPLWANKIVNKESWSKDEYLTTTTFKIKRKNIEIYQDKKWTFGVLTMGNKVDDVIKFCSSVRKLDPKNKHQILICGPRNSSYDRYNVDYVDNREKFREEYSEICAKKNSIVDQAKNQNLMICHDRYYLSENFFDGFEKYGYDFDFLTVNVLNEVDGSWFPHYIKMGYIKHEFKWHKEWYCFKNKEFVKNNELYPVFINGGLNIFKRDVIRKIRYNECFFWHQTEDVELSKEFMRHNLIPRANMFSTVITTKEVNKIIGVNLQQYHDVYGGEIRVRRKKLNSYKRIRLGLFKKIYRLITNKKLLDYFERIVLKIG